MVKIKDALGLHNGLESARSNRFRQLWCAVILQAIFDIRTDMGRRPDYSNPYSGSAGKWLFSQDSDHAFELAGIGDPKEARLRLIKQLQLPKDQWRTMTGTQTHGRSLSQCE